MDNYFKLLLNECKIVMSRYGFSKKGNNFFVHTENNYGIINFQKSTSSNKDKINFTINLGVCSSILREYFCGNSISVPGIIDCHWRQRIGDLLIQKQDFWWELNSATQINELINEIKNVLTNLAIPEILKYISDQNLEKFWLQNQAGGLTDLERCKYLITLMKLHKKENLPFFVKELREFSKKQGFEFFFREHLKEIGINYE